MIFQVFLNENILTSDKIFDTPNVAGDTFGWLDLSELEENIDDIARISEVYGIVNRADHPLTVTVLQDPTPGYSVEDDFWIFNRTEERLYIPTWAVITHDQFNFTYETWVNFTQQADPYLWAPPSFMENVTIVENVIGVKPDGKWDYFTKNFENEYSFYLDEPYFIELNAQGNAIEYINFSHKINIDQYEMIRGIVHYINNSDNSGHYERTHLNLNNLLR